MKASATVTVQQRSEGWDITGEDDQYLAVEVKLPKGFKRGQKVKVTVESLEKS